MRILVIDDNPFDRELIIQQLQRDSLEAEYIEVANQSALEEALKLPIDVVCVDYYLKWTTGLNVLKQIREQWPDLPVLMVTESGSEEIASEGMKAGLNDYVLKRNLEHLAFSIRECLEKARLREEQKALDTQKSEMISLLTHDLRTPLTSIKGYVDMLLMGAGGKLSENQHKFLKIIQENTNMLTGLVNDMLDLSLLESGTLQLDFGEVDLNAIIMQVKNSFIPLLEAKQQQLTIQTQADPSIIWGEAGRVTQILNNLLSNAYKYTPEGGRIMIATFSQEAMVRIEVRDSGVGMSSVELEHLFTKFFRARNTKTTKEKGTGLGMVITRLLIELHGGQIEVKSVPGEGTLMAFTLPIAPMQNCNEVDGKQQIRDEVPA